MSDQANKNDPSAYSELGENFAAHAQLAMQLRATPAERLRDLEAMWEFNEMVWARNPEILRTAQRLWALQQS